MMNKILFLINLALTFTFIDIAVAQTVIVNKKPTWVKSVSIPNTSQVSKYDVQSGVYHTLLDCQIDLDKEITYFHRGQKIVNNSGVSAASQVQLTFDSTYQEIVLHDLSIWRNDQKIDKTNHVKFEYIKNEQELESNIYSGMVTALAVIDDLRKNDILEVAYSIIGNNPVYEDSRYELFPLGDINPVDKLYVRAIYPSNQKYRFECHGCNKEEINELISGQSKILELERVNLEAINIEETMPPWIIPYDYLEISNTSSWKEVNLWALKLFDNKKSNKIEEVFKDIFYPEYSIVDKINASIDFVQDEIRYMGIESGIGNLIPFSPDQTIQQRFGDCKDKSLLLISMLRKIGIEESYVALVNTSMQHNLDILLPTEHAFDHCIVYFKYAGKEYWVDPTFPFQGGSFEDIVTYNYGKALVVSENTTNLIDMKVQNNMSKSMVHEHFDISTIDSTVVLNVKGETYGSKSDYVRQILEYYSLKELSEMYKYPLGLVFPTIIESKKLQIKDDDVHNVIYTEENYVIDDAWKEEKINTLDHWVFNYQPSNLGAYIFQVICDKKEYPIYIEFPVNFEQNTIFELPEIILLDTGVVSYDNDAFVFTKTTELLSPKTLKINYSYETKTNEIPAASFAEVCKHMNEIVYNVGVAFQYPKTSFFNVNSLINSFNNNSFTFEKDKNNLNSYIDWKKNILNVKDSTYASPDITLTKSNSSNSLLESEQNIEVQPAYPGGMAKLYKYISKHMKYPSTAKRLNVSGRVFVSFLVTKSGNLEDFKVVKGIGAGCDEEAVRLLESAGKWNPGETNNEPVDVRMILPITFNL